MKLDVMKHYGQRYEQAKIIKNSNTIDSALEMKRPCDEEDSYYRSPDRIIKTLKQNVD